MREGDARGRCLAVISHDLMNAHLSDDSHAVNALAAIEALGYGLMSLPPATQPESTQIAAVDQLGDQLQDYLRHGYVAVIVEDKSTGAWLARLDAICRKNGVPPPRHIRSGKEFRAALEAIRANVVTA